MRRTGRALSRLAAACCLASVLWIGACVAGQFRSMLPPIMTEKVPEAQPIGTDDCADCHDAEPEFYEASYHKLAFFQEEVGAGCESCHGNGSVHAAYFEDNEEYEDEVTDLVGSDDLLAMNAAQRSALCQQCHQADFPLWPTTDHARGQVSCWDCHPSDLHSPPGGLAEKPAVLNAQRDDEFCVQCHENVAAEFDLQFHHRVREGQMRCAECHPIHGEARYNTVVQERNVTCVGCHPEVQGPWIFEHLGPDEGCEACHQPHGSVNNKLLVANDNSLCTQCHFQVPFSFFGRQPHAQFLGGGGLCYDCHSQVHGSNTDRNFNPRRY